MGSPVTNGPTSYSVTEAAAILGVSRSWLYHRCQAHEVPHQRYGRIVRITPRQLEEIREQYAQPAIQTLHHLVPGRRRA
jgi:excisionase family DNA binding protein